MATARALLSPEFPPLLRAELETGKSFPAARAAALERMGLSPELLNQPNDILAVEYCKAILAQNCSMEPLPIHREGSYHAAIADQDNPSATAVRNLMLRKENWRFCVSRSTRSLLENAPLHTLEAGERAILARLRTMTDEEFEALPYGSEGLWRKLMHASREYATLVEILTATKSKRYTRTRLDRMVMCAFLGITRDMLEVPAPYTRVLALNDTGRTVLKEARKQGTFLNAGEAADHPYRALEKRCGDLYGLFATDGIGSPGAEERCRIFYRKETP
jgi:predicted nucleotidyltransferase